MPNRDMTDRKTFEESYVKSEAIYGRTPSALDIDRAYVRYLNKMGEDLKVKQD